MKTTPLVQLEFGMRNQIRNGPGHQAAGRRQRAATARIWFTRMRQIVNLALPPQPRLQAPPEQSYLPLKQTMLL